MTEVMDSFHVASHAQFSPRLPNQYSLSDVVYHAGLAAFGSPEKLEEAVHNSRTFTTHVNGFTLVAHCAQKDDLPEKVGNLTESYDAYGAHRLASMSHDTIVYDVGANLGILTSAFWKTNPKLSYIALEAMPETFFYMMWNFQENGIPMLKDGEELGRPGVLPLNTAIGSDGQWQQFSYPKFPGGGLIPGHELSSIHVHGEPTTSRDLYANKSAVKQSQSLGTLSRRLGINSLNKVGAFFDCQGCEFDGILPDASELGFMGGELHCTVDPAKCRELGKVICVRQEQHHFRVFDEVNVLHQHVDC